MNNDKNKQSQSDYQQNAQLGMIGLVAVGAVIWKNEDKIRFTDNEEDIKMREGRIKQLQKDFFEARMYIERLQGTIELHSDIMI